MQNIERVCFMALDASINNAFKVSNNPSIHGWHAGMRVRVVLDQLSSIYGRPHVGNQQHYFLWPVFGSPSTRSNILAY
jgi:hypothetical protein